MEEEQPAKILPDGRGAWIYPLTFGRARIVVGPIGESLLDNGW